MLHVGANRLIRKCLISCSYLTKSVIVFCTKKMKPILGCLGLENIQKLHTTTVAIKMIIIKMQKQTLETTNLQM